MGITKTDFVRGMQCPKMLWLDHHKPEQKEIPPAVQDRLNRGNDYGDKLRESVMDREAWHGVVHRVAKSWI